MNNFMKTKPGNLLLLAALSLTMTVLNGCASNKPSSNTVAMLSQAGFVVRQPKTPEQQQIFATLPPYKVKSIQVKGKTYYVYKDEVGKQALVGREAEYQRYRQISRQDRLLAGEANVEMMSGAEANTWVSAGGDEWWSY